MSYTNTRKKTKRDLLSRVVPAELRRLRVARRVNSNWRTNKQHQPNSAPLLRSIDDPGLVKVHLNPDEHNRPIFYLDYISVNEIEDSQEEKRKSSRERTIFQSRHSRADSPPETRATSRKTSSDSSSRSRSRSRISPDRNVRSSDLDNKLSRKTPERSSKNVRYDSKKEYGTRRKSESPAKQRDRSPRDTSSGRYRQETSDRQRKNSRSRSPPRPPPGAAYREPVELLIGYRRSNARTPSPGSHGKSKESHHHGRYGGSHSPPSTRYDRLKRSSRSPPQPQPQQSLRERHFNRDSDGPRRARSPPRSSPRRERSPKAGPSASTYRDQKSPSRRYNNKDHPPPNVQRARSTSPVARGNNSNNSRGEKRRRSSSRSPPSSRDRSDGGYGKRGRYNEDHILSSSSRSSPSRRVGPSTSTSSRHSPSSRDHPRRRTRSRSTSREKRYGKGGSSRSPTRHHHPHQYHHSDRDGAGGAGGGGGRERSDYHRKYDRSRRRTRSRSPARRTAEDRDDSGRSLERRGHRYGDVARSSSRNRRERSPLPPSKQRFLHGKEQQQQLLHHAQQGFPGPGPIVTPYGIFPGEEYWIPGAALPPQAFMPRVFLPPPGAFPRGAIPGGGAPGALLHPRVPPMMGGLRQPPMFRPPLQRLPVYNSAKIIRPKVTAVAATSTTTNNTLSEQKGDKNPSNSSSSDSSSTTTTVPSNNSNRDDCAESAAVQPTETRGNPDTKNDSSAVNISDTSANNGSTVVNQADTPGHNVSTSLEVVGELTAANDDRQCTAVGTTGDTVIDGGDEPVHSSSP